MAYELLFGLIIQFHFDSFEVNTKQSFTILNFYLKLVVIQIRVKFGTCHGFVCGLALRWRTPFVLFGLC